jgi:hypothetical protein
MKLITEAIEAHWGARCSEREEGCPVCDAWRQYDNLITDVKVTNLIIKEHEAMHEAVLSIRVREELQ